MSALTLDREDSFFKEKTLTRWETNPDAANLPTTRTSRTISPSALRQLINTKKYFAF